MSDLTLIVLGKILLLIELKLKVFVVCLIKIVLLLCTFYHILRQMVYFPPPHIIRKLIDTNTQLHCIPLQITGIRGYSDDQLKPVTEVDPYVSTDIHQCSIFSDLPEDFVTDLNALENKVICLFVMTY